MTADVSIIIVNWNGGKYLSRCVESIVESQPLVSYEIIVVDNCSTDGSAEFLRVGDKAHQSYHGRVSLIQNPQNLGFGKANNQAIASSNSPFLFLLNSDTEVMPGAIDKLINTLRLDDRNGVCAPRLLNSDGSLQPSVWRNPPTPLYIILEGLQLYRLIPKAIRGELLLWHHWDHTRRRRIKSVCGAALLAKREMIEQVGAFDDRFHMYGEDAEWCLRIVRSGWSIVFEPEAEVVHFGGQSAQKRWNDEERALKEEEGFLRFQELCLTPRQLMANTMTRAFVLAVIRMWRRVRKLPVDPLDRVIRMQVESFKETAWGLLRKSSRVARGRTIC